MEGVARAESLDVPSEFICPLSGDLMRDPVIVASGVTYERAFIEDWLASGRLVCPKTDTELHLSDLFPNVSLKRLITEWCARHAIPLDSPDLAPSPQERERERKGDDRNRENGRGKSWGRDMEGEGEREGGSERGRGGEREWAGEGSRRRQLSDEGHWQKEDRLARAGSLGTGAGPAAGRGPAGARGRVPLGRALGAQEGGIQRTSTGSEVSLAVGRAESYSEEYGREESEMPSLDMSRVTNRLQAHHRPSNSWDVDSPSRASSSPNYVPNRMPRTGSPSTTDRSSPSHPFSWNSSEQGPWEQHQQPAQHPQKPAYRRRPSHSAPLTAGAVGAPGVPHTGPGQGQPAGIPGSASVSGAPGSPNSGPGTSPRRYPGSPKGAPPAAGAPIAGGAGTGYGHMQPKHILGPRGRHLEGPDSPRQFRGPSPLSVSSSSSSVSPNAVASPYGPQPQRRHVRGGSSHLATPGSPGSGVGPAGSARAGLVGPGAGAGAAGGGGGLGGGYREGRGQGLLREGSGRGEGEGEDRGGSSDWDEGSGRPRGGGWEQHSSQRGGQGGVYARDVPGQGHGLRGGRESPKVSPKVVPAQLRRRDSGWESPRGETEGHRGEWGGGVEWRSEKGSVSARVGDRGFESDRGKYQRGVNYRHSPEGDSYSDRGEHYTDREHGSAQPEVSSDWEPVARGRALRDLRSPKNPDRLDRGSYSDRDGYSDRDQYSDRKGRNGVRVGEGDSARGLPLLSPRELGRVRSGLERRVDRALDALDSASASSDDVAEAIDFLQAALREDPGVQSRVLEGGGVRLVVDAMESRDSAVVEGAASVVLTLCESWEGGQRVAEADGVAALIDVLHGGTEAAKSSAAAALFSLASEEENRAGIRESGGIKPLVGLLGSSSARARKDAALALFALSQDPLCTRELVEEGTVGVLVDLLSDKRPGIEEKVMAVLGNLVKVGEGQEALLRVEGGIVVVLDVLESESACAREEALSALHHLVTVSRAVRPSALNSDGALFPVAKMAQIRSSPPQALELYKILLAAKRGGGT